MRKLNIGLDYDSICTDSRKIKADLAKRLFGKTVPYEDIKSYTTVASGLLTKEEYATIQYKAHYTPSYNKEAPTVPGAISYIKKLIDQGHTIRIVTGRDKKAAIYAAERLEYEGVPLKVTGVGKDATKRFACKGLDVFFDDDLHKLKPLKGIVPHLYLLSWPYNTHLAEQKIATRVKSWDEFYDKIQKVMHD